MKILHTADAHLGLTRYSAPGTTSRSDDFAQTLLRFADVATAMKVDVAILAGDNFHSRRPTPREILALTTAISRLREQKITVLLAPGNHDGMDVVGDPRTHALAWMTALQIPGVHVFTEPLAHYLHYGTTAFGVVAMPYPHKRAFDALMPDATPEERIEAIGRKLEDIIETYHEKVVAMGSGGEPVIFIGHLTVAGASLGTEAAMRFGWDVAIRGSILDRFDYGALGHIHRQQQVGERAWYPGSPEYMDFGEEGQRKGFLYVEAEKGRAPLVQVVDSHPRKIMTVNLLRTDDGWTEGTSQGLVVRDAIVRLRLTMPSDTPPNEVLKVVRDYRERGASYVKSEVLLPPDEGRQEARTSLDPKTEAADALARWLSINGYEAEPALEAGKQIINALGGG